MSTITGWEPPIGTSSIANAVLAWFSVAFTVLSLGIIFYRTIIDFNRLRLSCLILGSLTLATTIADGLHLMISLPCLLIAFVRVFFITAFADFMVAVNFVLGGKFYDESSRINILYWLILVGTVIVNVLAILDLWVQFVVPSWEIPMVITITTRVLLLAVLLLSYLYAFNPVMRMRMKMGTPEAPSSVTVAVGAWYLAGMGILLLPEFALGLYSFKQSQTQSIVDSIEAILRMLSLGFYSISPSPKIIFAIRRRFFPGVVMESRDSLGSVMDQNTNLEQIELEAGIGTKIPEEDQSTITSKTKFTTREI